jgi:hypothetical protein
MVFDFGIILSGLLMSSASFDLLLGLVVVLGFV